MSLPSSDRIYYLTKHSLKNTEIQSVNSEFLSEGKLSISVISSEFEEKKKFHPAE